MILQNILAQPILFKGWWWGMSVFLYFCFVFIALPRSSHALVHRSNIRQSYFEQHLCWGWNELRLGKVLPLLLLLNEKEKINWNWNSEFGLFTVSAGTSACTWSCWRFFWVFGVCLQTKVVRGVKRIVCECKLKSGFRSEKKKRWNVDDDAMKCKNKILN